jgi:hypothetical protein
MAEFVKVSGQIVFTEGIPDQTVRLFSVPDEDGRGAKGQSAFTQTDDEVDRFVC